MEYEKQIDRHNSYQVFRIVNSKKMSDEKIRVLINNQDELFFPAGCEGYGAGSGDNAFDLDSLKIKLFAGTPDIVLLQYSTLPEGNGGYINYYYCIFFKGNAKGEMLSEKMETGSGGTGNYGRGNWSFFI